MLGCCSHGQGQLRGQLPGARHARKATCSLQLAFQGTRPQRAAMVDGKGGVSSVKRSNADGWSSPGAACGKAAQRHHTASWRSDQPPAQGVEHVALQHRAWSTWPAGVWGSMAAEVVRRWARRGARGPTVSGSYAVLPGDGYPCLPVTWASLLLPLWAPPPPSVPQVLPWTWCSLRPFAGRCSSRCCCWASSASPTWTSASASRCGEGRSAQLRAAAAAQLRECQPCRHAPAAVCRGCLRGGKRGCNLPPACLSQGCSVCCGCCHPQGGGQVSQIYAIRQAIAKGIVAFYQKCEWAWQGGQQGHDMHVMWGMRCMPCAQFISQCAGQAGQLAGEPWRNWSASVAAMRRSKSRPCSRLWHRQTAARSSSRCAALTWQPFNRSQALAHRGRHGRGRRPR